MSRDFTPVYSSTADGSDLTLCRILEAVSTLAASQSNGGNALPFNVISTASVNATVVKASPGKVYNFLTSNLSNGDRYVKFYDKATTPNPSVDVPDYILPLTKNATSALALGVNPFVFHIGISFCIVTSISGGGNVGAGDVLLNLTWA